MSKAIYNEETIKSLEWREHIRMRPGMYIGKQGDGSSRDDGIYILVKEVMDNSVDEYVMGYGKKIDVVVNERDVRIRDYGRGIPLGKVIECVASMNTGAKYDSEVFKKSVGLNGVGSKAVNALSAGFRVESYRDGQVKIAEFEKGIITNDHPLQSSKEADGTMIQFTPDNEIFENFNFVNAYLDKLFWNYAYLNSGLVINFNGQKFMSLKGLHDLLSNKIDMEDIDYPIIHLKGDDIEVAMTHNNHFGEEYYTFVNGQYTPQGGTHLIAFKEAIVKTVREFFRKNFEPSDIRSAIIAAVSIKVIEPVFESQTKTKLGSTHIKRDGQTVKSFIGDFIKKELDDYLHKNPSVADAMLRRIVQSEKERKAISGIKKMANERAKKANIHNKKLRDCKVHFTDSVHEKRYNTTLFITEGDSASGSITKSRDIETQAVFSLKGKPLNTYGKKKNIVYENEEFNLLQHALNIEEGIDELRYNRIVIATDADVDGMHIRLLLMTFFLQFFPDLVKNGHLYILDTPLFRVRNKEKTIYCYSEEERRKALRELGSRAEITRFKGLGEISPDEFGIFIGSKMRLDPVIVNDHTDLKHILSYYMGNNTPERQEFIISNLKYEKDILAEKEVEI